VELGRGHKLLCALYIGKDQHCSDSQCNCIMVSGHLCGLLSVLCEVTDSDEVV